MKGRRQDQWLQDYLDGRLSAEEQARAEARIRKDEELSRRVEALRKIGDILREDSAELSPGFYTRARSRFERSLEPRSRFVPGWLSWEAASMAVAVVLVVALYVPELLLNRSPGLESPRPAEKSAPANRPPRFAEGEPRKDIAADPAGKALDSADAPPHTAPETRRSEREEFAPAPLESRPAPEIEEAFAATELDTARAGERKRHAGTEPTAEIMPRAPADAPGFRSRASAALGPTVRAIALPRQVLLPDGIQVIDDRSTWDAWLAGPAGPALSRLGSYEPGRRLVLVGRPGGIDCSTLTVSRLHNEYHVAFHHDGGPTGGCAFVLSGADGIAVVLED